jgi:hypothetical protein
MTTSFHCHTARKGRKGCCGGWGLLLSGDTDREEEEWMERGTKERAVYLREAVSNCKTCIPRSKSLSRHYNRR